MSEVNIDYLPLVATAEEQILVLPVTNSRQILPVGMLLFLSSLPTFHKMQHQGAGMLTMTESRTQAKEALFTCMKFQETIPLT